jgi:hypothetical protein
LFEASLLLFFHEGELGYTLPQLVNHYEYDTNQWYVAWVNGMEVPLLSLPEEVVESFPLGRDPLRVAGVHSKLV